MVRKPESIAKRFLSLSFCRLNPVKWKNGPLSFSFLCSCECYILHIQGSCRPQDAGFAWLKEGRPAYRGRGRQTRPPPPSASFSSPTPVRTSYLSTRSPPAAKPPAWCSPWTPSSPRWIAPRCWSSTRSTPTSAARSARRSDVRSPPSGKGHLVNKEEVTPLLYFLKTI